MDTDLLPACYRTDAERIALVAASHERLFGRPLVARSDDPLLALWRAPLAIVAHGPGEDPCFFFANRAALAAFETDAESIRRMPSRLSAGPQDRTARAAALARVAREGFIDDYTGVRVSTRGQRFRIEAARLWNLLDEQGRCHGQAAAFAPPDAQAAPRD
ncbi:MAG: MEKHLA domain-containing protein [Sphingomonadales bacterium]|nr:MEKHLA domain-containing protein [Sphingomonadales bacterium]